MAFLSRWLLVAGFAVSVGPLGWPQAARAAEPPESPESAEPPPPEDSPLTVATDPAIDPRQAATQPAMVAVPPVPPPPPPPPATIAVEAPGVLFLVLGVSGTSSLVTLGDAGRSLYSGLLGMKLDGYGYFGHMLAMHQRLDLALGGGGGGFAGWAEYQLGLGVHVGEPFGAVMRVGVEPRIWANPSVLSSGLSLPQLDLGAQWLTHDALIEVAGQMGLSTVGRFNPEDAQRKLGGQFECGVHAAVYFESLHLDAAFRQTDLGAEEPHEPVNAVQGSLCATPRYLGACATVRYLQGTVAEPDGSVSEAHALFLGVLAGLSFDAHET